MRDYAKKVSKLRETLRARALRHVTNNPRTDWKGNIIEEKLKLRNSDKFYDYS